MPPAPAPSISSSSFTCICKLTYSPRPASNIPADVTGDGREWCNERTGEGKVSFTPSIQLASCLERAADATLDRQTPGQPTGGLVSDSALLGYARYSCDG
ncbi:hypothetical protein WAI453_012781 [Rhynchosporium graminicola]